MDCTNCSYRVKCCPTCGTSLETEKEIAGKNISSTDDKIVESTEMKSHVECASFNENTLKEKEIAEKHISSTDDKIVESTEMKSHVECASFSENTLKDCTEIRMVCFGLPSSGVSSACNTICGTTLFKEGFSLDVITTTCQIESCERFGCLLKVADTPGFTVKENMRTAEEIFPGLKESIQLLTPGPHLVLLILPLDKLSEEIHRLFRCLGCFENMGKHVIVIFTKVDKTEQDKEKLKHEVSNSETYAEVLAFCDERFVLFDNRSKSEQQVIELLELMKKVIDGNGSIIFNNTFFTQNTNDRIAQVVKDCEEKKIKTLKQLESYVKVEHNDITDRA